MRQLSWSWVLALVIFAHSTLATCAYSQIVKAPIQPAEVEELAAVLSSGLFYRLTLAQLSMLTQGCTEAELAMFEPVVDPLLAHVGYGGIGRRESEEAARIVVRIGKTAVPSLLDGLHSKDERLRRMSINLLVRIDSREVALEKELIHLLNDRDDSVRQEVRRGLETVQKTSALTDKATATAIEARILVESPEIQLWLHHILARMPEHREAHLAAMKSFLSHEDQNLRLSAAKRLAELNSLPADAWQQLLPGLRDPAAGVRSQTAYEIGELGLNHEEVIDALIAILWHDEVKEVRRSAASALGKIGPVARRAMPALVAAIDEDSVSSTSTGWWVGLDAVGKVGGTDAIPVLMEYLTKPEMDLQLTAIRRLGDIGPAALEAVPAIDTFLDDEREWFRKAAALAISQITASPPASTLHPAARVR